MAGQTWSSVWWLCAGEDFELYFKLRESPLPHPTSRHQSQPVRSCQPQVLWVAEGFPFQAHDAQRGWDFPVMKTEGKILLRLPTPDCRITCNPVVKHATSGCDDRVQCQEVSLMLETKEYMWGHQRRVRTSSYVFQWVAYECLLSVWSFALFPQGSFSSFWTCGLFLKVQDARQCALFGAGGTTLWSSGPLKKNVFGLYWPSQTAFIKCPVVSPEPLPLLPGFSRCPGGGGVGKREGKTLGETYAILLSFTDPPGHRVSWELLITQRPVDI